MFCLHRKRLVGIIDWRLDFVPTSNIQHPTSNVQFKETVESMQLYFIRHGQSENNALWMSTGSHIGRSEDPGLTEVGRQQSELLAQFLSQADSTPQQLADFQNVAGFGITHLYTSLMIRAVATGTIIAKALDLPLVAWEDLHEYGGIYLRDEQTDERIGLPGRNALISRRIIPTSFCPALWARPVGGTALSRSLSYGSPAPNVFCVI
jgi:hypothetical protein